MDWLGKPRSPPWSDLPADLGGLILRLLPCHIDRLRFRSACRQWRLAEREQRPHLPPSLPLICLGGHTFLCPAGGELRRFRTDDVDVLRRTFPSYHGSFDCWLLYQRHGEGSKCLLVNPLSGATIEMPLRLDDGAEFDRFPMRKIIVCSPDLVAATLRGSSVAFYRPGAPSWSAACPSDYYCRRRRRRRGRGLYVDIALHRGKLYAINDEDELFVHQARASTVEHAITPQPPPAVAANPRDELLTCRYLVVSCAGKLLLVKWMAPYRRHPYNSRSAAGSSSNATDGVVLKVFEADLEGGRWTEVTGLDDGEALFVGGSCSKAVRLIGGDRRFQQNCVYVLGHDFFGCCYDGMPSYRSYDLGSGIASQVVLDRMQGVSPVMRMRWFFPQEQA